MYGKEEERRVVKILVSSEWKKEGNFGLPWQPGRQPIRLRRTLATSQAPFKGYISSFTLWVQPLQHVGANIVKI